MSTRPTSARPLSVMFVHAHPDDETTTTGAMIARYAAAGARTSWSRPCFLTITP